MIAAWERLPHSTTPGKEQARLCVQQMLLHLIEEASLVPLSDVDTRVLATIHSIEREPGATWQKGPVCLGRNSSAASHR